MIGPFGPARVTTTGMARPAGVTDEAWRELRATAGIVIRALLLDGVASMFSLGQRQRWRRRRNLLRDH
jgi:hypothetical protein